MCPGWLNKEAKAEWHRVVPKLKVLGLLTQIDRAALSAYCQSWARWRQAEAVIERDGFSIELKKLNKTGTREYVYAVQQRPEVTISQRERALMKTFLAEFGLSPASRSRVHAAPEKPADSFEDFLSGHRGTA